MKQPDASPEVWRSLEVGGIAYETTLPDGLNPFERMYEDDRDEERLQSVFRPALLDKIEPGEYEVRRVQRSFLRRKVRHNAISVRPTEYGKVVSIDSFAELGVGRLSVIKVLSCAGFEFDDDGLASGYPTPLTLQAAARSAGVTVELVDATVIHTIPFLEAYRNETYPVATGNQEYFVHDTYTDHLPGVIAGGALLKTMLSGAADRGLNGTPEQQDNMALDIDSYTMMLRSYIAIPYAREGSLLRLQDVGHAMGIPAHATEEMAIAALHSVAKDVR